MPKIFHEETVFGGSNIYKCVCKLDTAHYVKNKKNDKQI